MKIEEVPQERGIMPDNIYEVCYAIDDDGHYVLTASAGWNPKNIANNQAWEVIEEEIVLTASAGWNPKNIANNQAWEVIEEEISKALKGIHTGKLSPLLSHGKKSDEYKASRTIRRL